MKINMEKVRAALVGEVLAKMEQLNQDELQYVNRDLCKMFRRRVSEASTAAMVTMKPGDKVLSSRGRYGTVVDFKRTRVVVVFDDQPGTRWLCPANTLKKLREIPQDANETENAAGLNNVVEM